jgi:hypothetical protein
MTSNLLFAINDQALAATVTTSPVKASKFDGNNLLSGPRGKRWRGTSAATSNQITVDFGSAKAVDHLILGRMDLSVMADAVVKPTLTLESSPDNSTWTSRHSKAGVAISDLLGPNAEDYLWLPGSSVSARYWRVTLAYASAMVAELDKIYIGALLDIGRDPIKIVAKRERGIWAHKSRLGFELTYEGISHAAAMSLINNVVEIADWHPIYLVTNSYHPALNSIRCLHAELIDAKVPQKVTNQNDVTLYFKELV